MEQMERKMKHLEMIQGVINRMAGNSFMLKGWAVTLLAGIFALAEKDADKPYFLAVFIPILTFWGLDSYYLFQERLYRSLYDEVRQKPEATIDFSLKATASDSNQSSNSGSNHDGNSVSNRVSNLKSYGASLISPTELGFYLPLTIVCIVIILIAPHI